jgi:hypothetical protein
MNRTILAALLLMALIPAARPDLVYDIDYEPPAYTNGQHVGGGSGETISDSISGFSSQGLLIHDGGGINYLASTEFTAGVHLVSWDVAVPVLQGSSAILNVQLQASSGPILFDATVAGDGSGLRVEYGEGFPNPPSVSINPAQAYSFLVLIDLDANHYNFWLNGTLLEDTVALPPDSSMDLADFGQNQALGLQAGIDNFRWEVIPEPSSLLLLMLGCAGLCVTRRMRQPTRE